MQRLFEENFTIFWLLMLVIVFPLGFLVSELGAWLGLRMFRRRQASKPLESQSMMVREGFWARGTLAAYFAFALIIASCILCGWYGRVAWMLLAIGSIPFWTYKFACDHAVS